MSTSIPKPRRFRFPEVLLLSVSHFIHDVYSSFLAPLLPLLIEKLSMSLFKAGLLTTVMQVPALMNPYIGLLADRISLRYLVIIAPMMTAIPMSLIGVAPVYGVLLLLLFTAGISVAVFHVPAPVMIARLAGSRKGLGMSLFMTGGELARAAGPLVAVGAVSLWGLDGFYPIMVVGVAASGLLFWRLRNAEVAFHNQHRRVSLAGTWRHTRHILGPLAAVLIARGFMHGSIAAFLPTFIQSQTGNLWLAGASLTVFELSGVGGVLAAGSLSDHFGRRKLLLIALVGAPVSVWMFVLGGGWIRISGLVCAGVCLLSTTPVMLALVQEHAGSSPAAANGMFMMMSFLARSAIVVVVGIMADRIGLKNTYLFSGAIGVLGIPFIARLPAKGGS